MPSVEVKSPHSDAVTDLKEIFENLAIFEQESAVQSPGSLLALSEVVQNLSIF